MAQWPLSLSLSLRRMSRWCALSSCALLLAGALAPAAAGAAGDVGALDRPPAEPGTSSPAGARYSPPVVAPVVDPFRAPTTPYGPGNRGLEYRPRPGTAARAIGDGRVAFAGQVAGRLVVSIDHPDGLRSSLVGLAVLRVTVGDRVARGHVVGHTGGLLHLGVRRSGTYLDPATLFADPGPAILVPLPSDLRPGAGRSVAGFGPGAPGH